MISLFAAQWRYLLLICMQTMGHKLISMAFQGAKKIMNGIQRI